MNSLKNRILLIINKKKENYMKQIHLLISILLLNLISQNVFAQMKYPDTPRIAVEDTLHNIVIKDDYRWLEDGEDPKVIKWE